MPIMITKGGTVQYVKYKETLADVLGHSNFDGEDWVIGDRLVFEDGTESKIKQVEGQLFHGWDEPTEADLDEIKKLVGVPQAKDWTDLFSVIEARPVGGGCLASILLCVVLGAMGLTL